MSAGLRIGRIRLIDGVVIAAGALLLVKGIGFFVAAPDREVGPDGLPRFARVLAHARTNYVPPDPSTTGSVPEKGKDGTALPPPASAETPAPGRTAAPPASAAERAINERLAERREELQRRTRELETREKLIEDGERRLDAKAGEISAAEADKARDGAREADAEAASMKGLVIMYETMKPKEAARVFDRLPQDVLVPVVRQIAPRKMAEILAAMSPDKAERLTVALARRTGSDPRPAQQPGLPAGELPAIDLAPPRSTAAPRPASP